MTLHATKLLAMKDRLPANRIAALDRFGGEYLQADLFQLSSQRWPRGIFRRDANWHTDKRQKRNVPDQWIHSKDCYSEQTH